MNDILSLFEIVASAALVAAPAILLVRVLAGGEGVSLADLFTVSADAPWPRGVQEEEPTHWRVESCESQRAKLLRSAARHASSNLGAVRPPRRGSILTSDGS